MNIQIKIVVEYEDDRETAIRDEIACFERGDLLPETLGLTLHEGNALLAKVPPKLPSSTPTLIQARMRRI